MVNNKCLNIGLRYCLSLMLLCLAVCCNSQTITLYDAVTNAVKNYPLMQQRQAEVAAGTAHVTSVRSNRLPSLTFQDQFDLGTNNSLQGSYLTVGILQFWLLPGAAEGSDGTTCGK